MHVILTVYNFHVSVRCISAVLRSVLDNTAVSSVTSLTYKKLTQPVPGGGAIQTKLKLVEGWWLTWEATTLQTNWVPLN